MNDLKFALRQLLKNPGFTAVAVLTLALGIGATTAMFSFVNAILLRPLPYPDADRLVMVFENHAEDGLNKFGVGAPMLAEWRQQATAFAGLGAWTSGNRHILTGREAPETVAGARLSANVFDLLGLKPVLGRGFRPEEDTFSNRQVALLSHELWQRRFGGDTNIIGQTVSLDSELKTVIGIMPPRTHFPERSIEVWLPLAFQPWELQARHAHKFLVLGRLKPDVSLKQANGQMKLIAGRMAAADEESKGWGTEVHALSEIMVGDVRRPLLMLLGAVGLVLLIGCANIANLLLTRSAARAGEFAIRAALGAGRRHLLRQLLRETLLLFFLGGLGGVLLAAVGLEALVRLTPADLPRLGEGISLDGTTLAFTAIATLVAGLFCGLVPAWQASNPALAHELSENARGGAGVRRRRLRSALIVGEVALSVVLLIGAGLMIRSFGRLLAQEKGYQPEQVVTLGVSLPRQQYPGQAERERLFDRLLEAMRALPGVEAAGGALGLPLGGWQNNLSVEILGAESPAAGAAAAAGYAQVSPGYFAAMKIPILQGRDFTADDRTNTTPVLIVDEAFVRNFNLGTNVLGRQVEVGDNTGKSEIVGVVRTVKAEGLAAPPRGEMYRSYKQMSWGRLTFVVRTQRDATELTRAVRAALDQLDGNLPLDHVRTMTQLIASSVAPQQLSARLLAAFAGVALLLAAIGLYGVLAHAVMQRRRELGVRMALGAQRRDVLGLVIGQGMRLVLPGVGIGLAAALALSRVLQTMLFEVKPTDPLTFAVIPLVLGAVALLACSLPARRASRVDPMVALRSE